MGSVAFCKQGARIPIFLDENPVFTAFFKFNVICEANILKNTSYVRDKLDNFFQTQRLIYYINKTTAITELFQKILLKFN